MLYCGVLTKLECFIKMRAVFLAFILPRVMTGGGAMKAALILMKHFQFDRTLWCLVPFEAISIASFR